VTTNRAGRRFRDPVQLFRRGRVGKLPLSSEMQCKGYRGQHTTDARIAATQLSDPHPNLGKNTRKRHAFAHRARLAPAYAGYDRQLDNFESLLDLNRIPATRRLCCVNVTHIIRIDHHSPFTPTRRHVRRAHTQAARRALAWLWFPARLSPAAEQRHSRIRQEGHHHRRAGLFPPIPWL